MWNHANQSYEWETNYLLLQEVTDTEGAKSTHDNWEESHQNQTPICKGKFLSRNWKPNSQEIVWYREICLVFLGNHLSHFAIDINKYYQLVLVSQFTQITSKTLPG